MTTISLMRHGETDWNKEKRIQGRSDIPLNEQGIKQVGRLKEAIWNIQWNMIYSSPLKRAMKTAHIINEQKDVPVQVEEAFIEKSFGEVEGLAYDYVFSTYPEGIFPGAETDEEVVERVLQAFSNISEKHKGERILIVTHGAIIYALLSHFNVISGGLKHIILHPLSMNTFTCKNNEWVVDSFNVLPH